MGGAPHIHLFCSTDQFPCDITTCAQLALGDQDKGYTTRLAFGVQVWGVVRAKEISVFMGDSKGYLRPTVGWIPGSKGYLRPVLVADCGFSQELYWNTTPSGVPGHLLCAGRQVGRWP